MHGGGGGGGGGRQYVDIWLAKVSRGVDYSKMAIPNPKSTPLLVIAGIYSGDESNILNDTVCLCMQERC